MYKNNNYKKSERPRNETFEFPFVNEFKSRSSQVMDANQIIGILSDLNADDVFGTISCYVQIERKLVFNDPEKKGWMNIGFIKSVNTDAMNVSVTIYGNQVQTIKNLLEEKQLYFSPNVISDRNGDFSIFTNFNLVVEE